MRLHYALLYVLSNLNTYPYKYLCIVCMYVCVYLCMLHGFVFLLVNTCNLCAAASKCFRAPKYRFAPQRLYVALLCCFCGLFCCCYSSAYLCQVNMHICLYYSVSHGYYGRNAMQMRLIWFSRSAHMSVIHRCWIITCWYKT